MNYGQARHILQQQEEELKSTWIRALEMEFTDDGAPHTASYRLGWQAGIEAAAQRAEGHYGDGHRLAEELRSLK